MNVINSRYPYPLSRPLLEPRYPSSRSLEPYLGSHYGLETVLPRSRGYVNCACGAAISPLGNHLCRTCVLTTHAANQVLNIRGGDHCDCPACDLTGLDDDREIRDVIGGRDYYSRGSDICRSCGRRNCPLDCRNRVSLAARPYSEQYTYIRRDGRPLGSPPPYRWR
ncbi:hypothetical protein O988_02681 [Pseudogymnoascus sp. VKM F-3808]|nr:hypothetical protein O988_02681 [Pseudogymnoascus sp. VKM F-3808]